MSEMKKSFISDELVEVIKSVDYSVCNLEGVEVDHNTTHVDYPHQQFGTVSYLKSCGFNMCLLANNHITDGGPDRLNYTIDAIDNVRLDYIGAGFTEEQVYAARIKQIGNYKFGIINLCEAQEGQFSNSTCKYGYAWIGHFSIAKTISELRTKVDFILCFCHYGLEHYEVPLDCVRQYYYLLIDQGVDCIVGTHPHIAQGYEYYNDKLIVYSLGNFFFPRRTGRYDDENHTSRKWSIPKRPSPCRLTASSAAPLLSRRTARWRSFPLRLSRIRRSRAIWRAWRLSRSSM